MKHAGSSSNDFTPSIDVFDTETPYVVHVSLPGARKEDIGINYDEEKSGVWVTGVLHRSGSEEFLKTLAIGERRVGLLERKARLGNSRRPAVVDTDRISARLEYGVLEVTLPKEKEGSEKRNVPIDQRRSTYLVPISFGGRLGAPV